MVHIIMTYAREEGVVNIVENFENQNVLKVTIWFWSLASYLVPTWLPDHKYLEVFTTRYTYHISNLLKAQQRLSFKYQRY